MKRVICLLGVLVLAACDRPQYDVELVCNDTFLVNARIYNTHADLDITRVRLSLRPPETQEEKESNWLARNLELIDDKVSVTLRALPRPSLGDENNFTHRLGVYKYDNDRDLGLIVERNEVTNGVDFMLVVDRGPFDENNLQQFGFAYGCKPVVYRRDVTPRNMSPEQIKKMKNCANYIASQLGAYNMPKYMPEQMFRLYDEDSGREMFITYSLLKELTGGVNLSYYHNYNLPEFWDEISNACDGADRLREYIKSHIDDEYIWDDGSWQ